MTVHLAPINPLTSEVCSFIQRLDQFQIDLYGRENCYLDTPEELSSTNVILLGAHIEGNLVGIGAIKFLSDYGELKRIFVDENHRGKGIAKKIILALESQAKERGINLIKLETGVLQLEAISLYENLGYNSTAFFGEYEVNGISYFMEKYLT